jgi:signal transduction histidine kinase/CheY-like chemotaxis protein
MIIPKMSGERARLWKSMTFRYAAGLSAIAALTLGTHLVVQSMLNEQAIDNEVIDLAFHQRSLAQRLGSTLVRTQFASTEAEKQRLIAEMRGLTEQMNESQREFEKILGPQSQEFLILNSGFLNILRSIEELDHSSQSKSPREQSQMQAQLERLLSHEIDFREAAQTLGLKLQKKMRDRFETLRRTELQVLLSILFVLTLEALFVFRPGVNEIRRVVAELDRSKKLQSDFIARMSHEIRNPMNAMLGMADLLSERVHDTESRKYVQVIRRAGQTLMGFLSDLLDFSKLESQILRIHPERMSPVRLIEDVVDLEMTKAREKGLFLRFEVSPNTPEVVVADRSRVLQVLLNLTQNAIKFTKAGGVTIQVSATSDQLLFSVMDTGPGIAPKLQEHIFESFVQLEQDALKNGGGAGLGLSIARQLVSLMGGKIRVDSAVGRGSIFEFSIPLQTAAHLSKPELSDPSIPRKFSPKRSLIKAVSLLVVDDSRDNHIVIEAYLKEMPVQIDHAYSGAQALEKVCTQSYDLILMDVQMPEMNGYETTHSIRQYEQKSKKPKQRIVMLTANDDPKERARAIDIGADDFYVKPIFRDTLFSILEKESSSNPQVLDPALKDLAVDYLESRKADLMKMKMALQVKDFTTLAEIAHRIRGSAASYGFTRLGELSLELEKATKSLDPEAECRTVLQLITECINT